MRKITDKIYCFSPSVMLATFLFEVISAGIAFWKYKIDDTAKLIIAVLLALAGFQAAEFMVCGGFGLSGIEWARFGYVSITLLPPLGLHLAHKMAGVKTGKSVWLAWASCVIFCAYYLFATQTVSVGYCRANYSVFNTPEVWSELFGVYYYGWLIFAVIFICREIRRLADQESKNIWRIIFGRSRFFAQFLSDDKLKTISALKWFLVGYIAFMLPTTVVNVINPATIEGIPSIMCGFAVLLAMVLIGFVAPRSLQFKNKK